MTGRDVQPENLSPVMLLGLTPAELRHLAAALEARDPELVARQQLTSQDVEELGDMLIAGRRPTIGWWKRRLPPQPLAPRPMPTFAAVAHWAHTMAASGWPEVTVARGVVEAAVAAGLDQDTAEDACAHGIAAARRERRHAS